LGGSSRRGVESVRFSRWGMICPRRSELTPIGSAARVHGRAAVARSASSRKRRDQRTAPEPGLLLAAARSPATLMPVPRFDGARWARVQHVVLSPPKLLPRVRNGAPALTPPIHLVRSQLDSMPMADSGERTNHVCNKRRDRRRIRNEW
jgi:hypothetical protein